MDTDIHVHGKRINVLEKITEKVLRHFVVVLSG